MLQRHSIFPWRLIIIIILIIFCNNFVFWYPFPLLFPIALFGWVLMFSATTPMLYSRQTAAGCSTSMPKVPVEINFKIAPNIACINNWIRLSSCVTVHSSVRTLALAIFSVCLLPQTKHQLKHAPYLIDNVVQKFKYRHWPCIIIHSTRRSRSRRKTHQVWRAGTLGIFLRWWNWISTNCHFNQW